MHKFTFSGVAYIKACILFVITALSVSSSAQDIHFSQFYEAPLDLNPALGGAYSGKIYAAINYRTQWSAVAGPGFGFNTMAATAEYHNILKNWTNGYLSPGLDIYNDRSGDASIGITQVNFNLASGICLNDKNCLSVGLQGGYAQHSINTTNLQWDNQYINGAYDANAPTGEPNIGNSFGYADFSAGILYSYGTGQTTMTDNNAIKANVGAAIYHVNEPNMTYYGGYAPNTSGVKLYMRYVVHGELIYGLQNTNINLMPAFVFYQQGPAQEIDAGIRVRYLLHYESKYTSFSKGAAFDLGGFYRVGDAFIILAGLEFASYAFTISYDVNTSSLTNASSGRGGLELSLRLINPSPFIGNTESGTTTRSIF
jgi:type IX secretion system PorP/SprF family membrane protein